MTGLSNNFYILPDVIDTLFRLAVLMLAFPIHEFAHAWVATRFGDETPRRAGRLTLNPLAHLDLWGTLLFLFTGFGWAKPVPISPYALRSRKAYFWVAFAGPLSNLLLAVTAAALYRVLVPALVTSAAGHFVLRFLVAVVFFDLLLFFFNLLPIAPLDGDKVVAGLFPRFWQTYLAPLQQYGMLVFLLVVFVLPRFRLDVLTWLVVLPTRWLGNLLLG